MNVRLEIESLAVQCGNRTVEIKNKRLNGGDCLILSGANGAGKTSVLRVLAGLRRAEEITLRWNDRRIADLGDADWGASLSYIGHANAMKSELSVSENLVFFLALKNRYSSASGTAMAIADAATRFGLEAHLNRRCALLSAGQMRRLSLCRLLMEDAPLWLLDEPATALDSEARRVLNECISAHLAKGGIAVMATHQALIPDVNAQTLCLDEAFA